MLLTGHAGRAVVLMQSVMQSLHGVIFSVMGRHGADSSIRHGCIAQCIEGTVPQSPSSFLGAAKLKTHLEGLDARCVGFSPPPSRFTDLTLCC